MSDVKPGYYTIQDRDGDADATVCRVDEYRMWDEVEIMHYTPGYKVNDVFGPSARFKVLAGPWELPVDEK